MFQIPNKKLVEGAELCRDNAVMLATTAADIFDEHPVVGSFLSILALEEVGKGICLLKKHETGNDLEENEWNELAKWGCAHERKLKAVDVALRDPYSLLKPHDLSVQLEQIKDLDDQAYALAREVQHLKLAYLYVDWDRETAEWIQPISRQVYDSSDALERLKAAICLLSQKLRTLESEGEITT
jgi:AbiV family abortive infection protein